MSSWLGGLWCLSCVHPTGTPAQFWVAKRTLCHILHLWWLRAASRGEGRCCWWDLWGELLGFGAVGWNGVWGTGLSPRRESTDVPSGPCHGAGNGGVANVPLLPCARIIPSHRLNCHREEQSSSESRQHGPDRGQGDTGTSRVPSAATRHPRTCFWWPVCAGAGTILPHFPSPRTQQGSHRAGSARQPRRAWEEGAEPA